MPYSFIYFEQYEIFNQSYVKTLPCFPPSFFSLLGSPLDSNAGKGNRMGRERGRREGFSPPPDYLRLPSPPPPSSFFGGTLEQKVQDGRERKKAPCCQHGEVEIDRK